MTLVLLMELPVINGACKPVNPPQKSFDEERHLMVQNQIKSRGISDPAILEAMRKVERHLFVSEINRQEAYEDHPVPIGEGQTISQPYIVAKMTELARVGKGSKVLEIGTGSGYQAAILTAIGAQVYSIEILESVGKQAEVNLQSSGYIGVKLKIGDGYQGWPDEAPFDAIIVTAAPEKVPPALIEQLKIGSKLVIPVGRTQELFRHQELWVITKTSEGTEQRTIFPVAFVPMTGEAEKR